MLIFEVKMDLMEIKEELEKRIDCMEGKITNLKWEIGMHYKSLEGYVFPLDWDLEMIELHSKIIAKLAEEIRNTQNEIEFIKREIIKIMRILEE